MCQDTAERSFYLSILSCQSEDLEEARLREERLYAGGENERDVGGKGNG